MSPVGFEPAISAGERPHTYALDRATTGIDVRTVLKSFILYSESVVSSDSIAFVQKNVSL